MFRPEVIQKQRTSLRTSSKKFLSLHWNYSSGHWSIWWILLPPPGKFYSERPQSWRWKSWKCGRNHAWIFGTSFPVLVWPRHKLQDVVVPPGIYQYRELGI